jgi:hypothetical protein
MELSHHSPFCHLGQFATFEKAKLELKFVNLDLKVISLCDMHAYQYMHSVRSLVMFFHLRFSSIPCSSNVLLKEILNVGFTVIYICVSAC